MTNHYQQNAARWMCEDNHEALSELDLREQLRIDRRDVRIIEAVLVAAGAKALGDKHGFSVKTESDSDTVFVGTDGHHYDVSDVVRIWNEFHRFLESKA